MFKILREKYPDVFNAVILNQFAPGTDYQLLTQRFNEAVRNGALPDIDPRSTEDFINQNEALFNAYEKSREAVIKTIAVTPIADLALVNQSMFPLLEAVDAVNQRSYVGVETALNTYEEDRIIDLKNSKTWRGIKPEIRQFLQQLSDDGLLQTNGSSFPVYGKAVAILKNTLETTIDSTARKAVVAQFLVDEANTSTNKLYRVEVGYAAIAGAEDDNKTLGIKLAAVESYKEQRLNVFKAIAAQEGEAGIIDTEEETKNLRKNPFFAKLSRESFNDLVASLNKVSHEPDSNMAITNPGGGKSKTSTVENHR